MTWRDVETWLATQPAGATRVVDRGAIESPATVGAVVSAGLPRGELRGWRFPPSITCRGLHVHEFADHYVAHLDQVHPACDLVEHVHADAPELLALGIVGAVAGVVVAGGLHRRGRALFGAGVGATIGALAAAWWLRPVRE